MYPFRKNTHQVVSSNYNHRLTAAAEKTAGRYLLLNKRDASDDLASIF